MVLSEKTSEDLFHLGVKALIRDQEGNVLLLQANPAKLKEARETYWDLPGGRVQKGQTVTEALTREMAEETGVNNVPIGKELGMVLSNVRIPLSEGGSVGLILGIYECQIADGTPIIISDEHVAYAWLAPQKAAELLAVKYPEDFCAVVAAL